MSKYRKQFLSILKPMWVERLPEWQPDLFSPSFWIKPDATFSWTRFASNSTTRFHAYVEFSSKVAGMFTCDIFITDATNKLESKDIHRRPDEITTQKLGAYRIGDCIQWLSLRFWRLPTENEGLFSDIKKLSTGRMAARIAPAMADFLWLRSNPLARQGWANA